MLGVDIGGTKVATARIEGAAPRERVEHPTSTGSAAELLDGVEAAVAEVTAATGPPAGVGVGVPSQIEFRSGRVLASVNIPLEGVPLREELSRRLGAPVFVDNDANCAALAEAESVPGGVARDLVMLTIGTGVGGGVVSGGQVFRGATGLGAELGHLVIDENGPACPGNCPNRGCVEAFCSGQALERDATELGRDRPDSPLGRIAAERGKVRGVEVVELAHDGDPDARALLTSLGTHLGVAIAGIMNAFEPEEVVIGGGLSRAADLFIETARHEATGRALRSISERVKIALARAGPDAGVIGAGLLAERELGRG